ncbi:glycosyltransferase family 4 protein [Pseudoalteromonas sp. SG44-8]|uniref:glycosyltransferase family 4 protein n=1 Tax=Pseudoalteromonas sp. SG44-8 TaxID=2760958 RepID=UPI0016020EF4|nr:glycosyltransferase family 4 protein [Pseudoalteromonas sp. SG44-8]MBB1399443.1 glycosyltransferase family 4 protein [Pseudoalteromonas sp. SG44-8]
MIDKISIIGPFPNPIHGMSLANQTIFNYFKAQNNIDIQKFDISLSSSVKSKKDQGRFKITVLFFALVNLIKLLLFIVKRRGGVFYFTPPQSVLGYLRISPAIILAKIMRGHCIIHFHGARFKLYYESSNFLFKALIRSTFIFVDNFVLLGKTIKKEHSSLIEKEKIIICANGVEPPQTLTDKKLFIGHRVNILFLSNLMADKGFFEFCDAVKKLSTDKYAVHIAGAIEKAHQTEIKNALESLGSIATYHGVVYEDKKDELFSKSNIFVLPSYDEGQPMSILEAYSYGLTVITTNAGGIPDIFTDSINGRSVSIGSAHDIKNAIENINDEDMHLYRKNNIEAYERLYTSDAFCKRILNICKR